MGHCFSDETWYFHNASTLFDFILESFTAFGAVQYHTQKPDLSVFATSLLVRVSAGAISRVVVLQRFLSFRKDARQKKRGKK